MVSETVDELLDAVHHTAGHVDVGRADKKLQIGHFLQVLLL